MLAIIVLIESIIILSNPDSMSIPSSYYSRLLLDCLILGLYV